MANLAIIVDGVNLRRSGSTSADILLTTTATRNFCTVFGKSGPTDDSGHQWLEIRGDDGLEAWVRVDKCWRIVGDFRPFGAGAYDMLVPAVIAFPPTGAVAAQPPATAPSSPASAPGSKWASPVSPTTNENDYGAVYAGVTHDGIDLAGKVGLPIRASAPGVVALASKSAHGNKSVHDEGLPLNSPAVLNDPGWNYGYANVCIVRYDRSTLPASAQAAITAKFAFVMTAHCDSLVVVQGATVKAGDVLAYLGDSGNTDGNHVHLSVGISDDPNPANIWRLQKVNPHLLFAF